MFLSLEYWLDARYSKYSPKLALETNLRSRYPPNGNENFFEKHWAAVSQLQYNVHEYVPIHSTNWDIAFPHSFEVGTWYPIGHGHCLTLSHEFKNAHHHRLELLELSQLL